MTQPTDDPGLPPAIELAGLCLYRDAASALPGIGLVLPRGAALLVAGKDDLGKSGLIRVLAGLSVPGEGHVRVLGLDPLAARVELAARSGVIISNLPALHDTLTLAENLWHLGALRGMSRQAVERARAALAEELDLGPQMARPVGGLSRGARQRGAIAAALLHEPELLLLDDALSTLELWALDLAHAALERRVARGTTLVTTTCREDALEALATHLLVLEGGRARYAGALDEERARGRTLRELLSSEHHVPPV